VLRSVVEEHPKTERAGEFGKLPLLLDRELVNQSAGALGGKSWVPKKRRAICVFEHGPNAAVNIEILKPAPVKVSTVRRIWVSQEFRREEFVC